MSTQSSFTDGARLIEVSRELEHARSIPTIPEFMLLAVEGSGQDPIIALQFLTYTTIRTLLAALYLGGVPMRDHFERHAAMMLMSEEVKAQARQELDYFLAKLEAGAKARFQSKAKN